MLSSAVSRRCCATATRATAAPATTASLALFSGSSASAARVPSPLHCRLYSSSSVVSSARRTASFPHSSKSSLSHTSSSSMSSSHPWHARSHDVRTLFIQTEDTPNPASLKFVPGQDVLGAGNTRDYSHFKEAQRSSPLAAKLFTIDGVTGVFLGPNFVTVSIALDEAGEKGGTVEWATVKPEVFAMLTAYIQSGKPMLVEDAAAAAANAPNMITDEDDEVVAMIKELIETRIRPAVQEDGGDIVFREFDTVTGIVRLQLQGSCAGCPSSSVTLKSGIENMLMHYIPEVEGVEEFVDPEAEAMASTRADVSDDALRKLEEGLAKVRVTQEANEAADAAAEAAKAAEAK